MINRLITAFGTVCLSYVFGVLGVGLRMSGEDPSGAGMVILGLQMIPLKYPQFFLLATLPIALINIPTIIICSSFIFAFFYPKQFVDMVISCSSENN